MGGLCVNSIDTSVSHQETLSGTEIPEWVSQQGQQIFGQASALAQRPLDLYPNQRNAGFAPDEVAGFAQTWNNQGAYRPYLNQAGQQWGEQSAVDQYTNPFQQNVTDITKRELNRDFAMQNDQNAANAAQASAFGGARHGILDAETQRNQMQTLSDVQFQGDLLGYQNAQNMFTSDRARALQVAPQASQLGYQDAAALANIGQAQRGLQQQNLNTAYSDFLEQRENPYRMVNFALGTLQGTPYETQTFNQTAKTSQTPGGSPFGQAAGALAALGGAGGLFGG